MSEGLNLEFNDFEKLPTAQKLNCLYQNQCTTIRLIKGYKLYYRITAILGTFILGGMGVLFKMHINN